MGYPPPRLRAFQRYTQREKEVGWIPNFCPLARGDKCYFREDYFLQNQCSFCSWSAQAPAASGRNSRQVHAEMKPGSVLSKCCGTRRNSNAIPERSNNCLRTALSTPILMGHCST